MRRIVFRSIWPRLNKFRTGFDSQKLLCRAGNDTLAGFRRALKQIRLALEEARLNWALLA
jgi:hypothetical protein